MKTFFGRTFIPAALVILIALGGIGLFFQYHTNRTMEQRTLNQLAACSETLSRLAVAYDQESNPDFSDFLINLSVAAEVAEAQIQLCSPDGHLVLCSDAPTGCKHQGMQLDSEYLDRVTREGFLSHTGQVKGIYKEVRHVVSKTVYDKHGHLVGIVVVSAPSTAAEKAMFVSNRLFLVIVIAVCLLAMLLMSWVTNRHSRPLRRLSNAAVAFGHGDLDARVKVNPTAPEEIRELALAFNNMAASLQKSEYMRQEFVANISHELKTPMTTIAGFADGILDGTIPAEKQRHYLLLISEETKRLSRLVRSMLDISRLQEHKGVPEESKSRFDMVESAGQTLLRFERAITEKALNVEVELPDHPVYTRAHQDQIVQVLFNLLDNAVKFCPQEGDLALKLRTGGNKIYLSIRNSGQTIPAEELPLVFDRFHKLDKSRSQNRDGWGLGLYIVKTIVGAHGENISVQSQDGQTEFTFTLPLIN